MRNADDHLLADRSTVITLRHTHRRWPPSASGVGTVHGRLARAALERHTIVPRGITVGR